MARTQAADYDERAAAILDAAAAVFARDGFASASLAEIARQCGVSKSLVYHYHASKEDMLFAVMAAHISALCAAAATVPLGSPEARLRGLSAKLMEEYAGSGNAQTVLLNELDRLSAPRRARIVGEQRGLVAMVEGIIRDLAPAMPRPARTASAMLFFGMLNWTHVWWDPEGPLGPEAIADLAAETFLKGLPRAQAS